MAVRRRLASLADLQARKTIKFTYREEGIPREGFLAWFDGRVVCYQNVCRHIPITLDYGDARFFNSEGTHFVCQTHGATYEPLSGLCVAGPCVGAFLKPLKTEVIGDEIWWDAPE
jgi:nitrite reductase/ring-hydroxylating ferredoxin subunit